MAKVEIYTQFGCGYCARALRLFRDKMVTVEETDVTFGGAAREAMRARAGGGNTVPQIFIDNVHVGGCDDLFELDLDGKLDLLLGL
ncbi:MAG: glutaredoxin 3 [Alphaproteobacteria bacterium]|nr:glutaredoxin 3 [Alphaproteobacteria bacterium]MDE2042152.1 glutaredoxin 3 [Alphaproteobacteria bacterium]MDE2340790.1 glutaredoxin 3 [Alphaproteobacteria bacterium]